jgi:hypothetical protein
MEYIRYGEAGWESRVKGLHDAGYSWRVLADDIGMDKMTLWRACAGVKGDDNAWAYAPIKGEESRVWPKPDSRLGDLGEYAKIDSRRRGIEDQRYADEWKELALKERDRGVSIKDIARVSNMSRDQVNYRLRKK